VNGKPALGLNIKEMMELFIGSENIVSPLGKTAAENFNSLKKNETGIKQYLNVGFKGEDIYLSKISVEPVDFYGLLRQTLSSAIQGLKGPILISDRCLVIVSTTKADISTVDENTIHSSMEKLESEFKLGNKPLVISNACISGVMALNTGAKLIRNKSYDHAIIIGCDTVSNFVLYGFQSLFAISNLPCKPFSANRKGITLGEGAATIVISKEKNLFSNSPLKYLAGSSSNDANHISGPSRTGEGLVRTITKTLKNSSVSLSDIDFISAHGTGTLYNDEMESIALDRMQLNNVPTNSLKGYYGHTLGAAGVIETAISMQCMRNDYIIKSLGFEEEGTSCKVNMIKENKEKEINIVLKTASGFGGCNASVILSK
jgi:3-oxoacyl-[acyl-carrier-protein] synthase I